MIPFELKNIKKGDIFYERGGLDWYKFEALNDARCIGQIEIYGNAHNQYKVDVLNEFGEKTYLLVTEGLNAYNGKYHI